MNDSDTIEELLLRVAGGDRQAFAGLYEATRGSVYAMALSILANHHDAEEVSHDTYLRLWENAGKYRARGTPMAWILKITKNLALMRLRSSGRGGELSEAEWDAIPAQSGLSVEDRELLGDSLGALEAGERQVVLLHAVSGLKHREIAKLLNLPLGTVLARYSRAIGKLRRMMEGDESL